MAVGNARPRDSNPRSNSLVNIDFAGSMRMGESSHHRYHDGGRAR